MQYFYTVHLKQWNPYIFSVVYITGMRLDNYTLFRVITI